MEEVKQLLKDARQLVADKDFKGALVVLSRALALDSRSVSALVMLALCHHKTGQLDLSRKGYDAVLKLQPDSALAIQVLSIDNIISTSRPSCFMWRINISN
jgi:Tfp pilus assembly protein PilF